MSLPGRRIVLGFGAGGKKWYRVFGSKIQNGDLGVAEMNLAQMVFLGPGY